MIGKFVDVKITDVYTNSLRGEVVRTEDEWDYVLRNLHKK